MSARIDFLKLFRLWSLSVGIALGAPLSFVAQAQQSQPQPVDPHPCSSILGGRHLYFAPLLPQSRPAFFRSAGDLSGGTTGNPNDFLLEPYNDALPFVGRFVSVGLYAPNADGWPPNTNGFLNVTAHEGKPVPELDRIFYNEGLLASFTLSSFSSTVKRPLEPKLGVYSLSRCLDGYGGPISFHVKPDFLNEPDNPASGWKVLDHYDSHSPHPQMTGFDVDSDRGLVFHSFLIDHDTADIGIFKEDGAGQMRRISQLSDGIWARITAAGGSQAYCIFGPCVLFPGNPNPGDPRFVAILQSVSTPSVKSFVHLRSADRYFLMASRGSGENLDVYDVTDPAHPEAVTSLKSTSQLPYARLMFGSYMAANAARITSSQGHALAVIGGGTLNFFSAAELTRVAQPLREPRASKVISPDSGFQFSSVTEDGHFIYALMSRGLAVDPASGSVTSFPKAKIVTFEASDPNDPGSFMKVREVDVPGSFGDGVGPRFNLPTIRFGAGYLVIRGYNYPGLHNGCTQLSGCGSIQNYLQWRIYKLKADGALVEVPTGDYLTKHFLGQYPDGKKRAPDFVSNAVFPDAFAFHSGADDYLSFSATSLGDVYKIAKPAVVNTTGLPLCPTPSPTPQPIEKPSCTLSSLEQRRYVDGDFQIQCLPSAGIKVECKVDNLAWAPCSTQSTTGAGSVADGVHKMTVRAWEESFPSWDAAPASLKTDPELGLDSGFSGGEGFFTLDRVAPQFSRVKFSCDTGHLDMEIDGRADQSKETTMQENIGGPMNHTAHGLWPVAPIEDVHCNLSKDADANGPGFTFETSDSSGRLAHFVQATGQTRFADEPGNYFMNCEIKDLAGNRSGVGSGSNSPIIDSTSKFSCP